MFVTDKDFAEHIVGGREMRCNGFYVMLNLSTGKDLWSCLFGFVLCSELTTVCTEIFALCNFHEFRESVSIREYFILRKTELVGTAAASNVLSSLVIVGRPLPKYKSRQFSGIREI